MKLSFAFLPLCATFLLGALPAHASPVDFSHHNNDYGDHGDYSPADFSGWPDFNSHDGNHHEGRDRDGRGDDPPPPSWSMADPHGEWSWNDGHNDHDSHDGRDDHRDDRGRDHWNRDDDRHDHHGDRDEWRHRFVRYYKDLCDRGGRGDPDYHHHRCDPGGAAPLPGGLPMFAAALALGFLVFRNKVRGRVAR